MFISSQSPPQIKKKDKTDKSQVLDPKPLSKVTKSKSLLNINKQGNKNKIIKPPQSTGNPIPLSLLPREPGAANENDKPGLSKDQATALLKGKTSNPKGLYHKW